MHRKLDIQRRHDQCRERHVGHHRVVGYVGNRDRSPVLRRLHRSEVTGPFRPPSVRRRQARHAIEGTDSAVVCRFHRVAVRTLPVCSTISVASMHALSRWLTLAALVAMARSSGAEPRTLRFATAAPDGTTWARELRAVSREVEQETEGAVRVKWYFSGIAGNELDVIDRIRRGQ